MFFSSLSQVWASIYLRLLGDCCLHYTFCFWIYNFLHAASTQVTYLLSVVMSLCLIQPHLYSSFLEFTIHTNKTAVPWFSALIAIYIFWCQRGRQSLAAVVAEKSFFIFYLSLVLEDLRCLLLCDATCGRLLLVVFQFNLLFIYFFAYVVGFFLSDV